LCRERILGFLVLQRFDEDSLSAFAAPRCFSP